MKKFIVAIAIATAALLPGITGAGAVTEHCPDGGTKIEANGGTQVAINNLVPAAGTLVCVKGSTDATGIVTADGVKSLVQILSNGHDVSYYVTYPPGTTTTTTVPEVTTTSGAVTVTTKKPTCPELGMVNFPTTDRDYDDDGDGIGCESTRTGTPVTVVPEAAPVAGPAPAPVKLPRTS